MSLDEIFDLTAGVYFNFYSIVSTWYEYLVSDIKLVPVVPVKYRGVPRGYPERRGHLLAETFSDIHLCCLRRFVVEPGTKIAADCRMGNRHQKR